MKYFITILALSSALLANTQLQAHDSYWKNSSGIYLKNSTGNCWMTGAHSSDEAKCGAMPTMTHKHAAPAMAKAPAAAMTDEPVIKEIINLKGVTFKTGSNEINESSSTDVTTVI